MQVQRRPTTKDLDDAKLAMRSMMMPVLAVWLVSLPKAIFRLLVFPHACYLIFVGFALHRNSQFVGFAFEDSLQFYWFLPEPSFRRYV